MNEISDWFLVEMVSNAIFKYLFRFLEMKLWLRNTQNSIANQYNGQCYDVTIRHSHTHMFPNAY